MGEGGSPFRQKLLSYQRDFCSSYDLLLNFGLTFCSNGRYGPTESVSGTVRILVQHVITVNPL